MKKLITFFIAILSTYSLFAQAPQKMSYQAVIRNASGNLVVSAPVKMRISILQGSANGTSVYSELHNPTTNANGLVTIEIGGGSSPQGTFSSVNWGSGLYFLKIEADPANGTTYSVVGTSQLLSVPYALQANNAGNGFKRVSISGDTLFWENGKSIIIPGISNANMDVNPGTVTGITVHSCGAAGVHNPMANYGNLKDRENNVYKTVQIGAQTWMAENLRTTVYRNGATMLNIIDSIQWRNYTQGAYSSYDNNPTNDCPYGKLYNLYAVMSSNQLCPTGWHLPTDADWNVLIANLDPSYNPTVEYGPQSSIAGGKMKSTGTAYWLTPNTAAANSSGFSALPGGLRSSGGSYGGMGRFGYWWSNTPYPITGGSYWGRSLAFDFGGVYRGASKTDGFSVRCLKD